MRGRSDKILEACLKALDEAQSRTDEILNRRVADNRKRAEVVFSDWMCMYAAFNEPDISLYELDSIVSQMDSSISDNLDHASMPHFVEMIASNHESALQAAKSAKRHAENYAMQEDIYQWMDENWKPGMSFDSAASEIAGKVVPLAWRTVREHITDWNKLRSAG